MTAGRPAAITVAVAGIAATAAVSWPIVDTWFVGDDLENVLGGRHGGPFATQSTHPVRNFRPFHLWSLGVNHRLGGLDPVGYHLVNLLLHLTAALLVVALVRAVWDRIELAGSLERANPSVGAVVAGAWFLVAPNHVEAIAWIDARTDLAATALLLAALLYAVRALPGGGPGGGPGGATRWRLASLLAYAASFGWKEIGITFPFVVAIVAVALAPERRVRSAANAAAPYAALAVAYLVVRRVHLGGLVDGGVVDAVGLTTPGRTLRGLAALSVRSVLPAMPPAAWFVALPALAAAGVVVVRAASGRSASTRIPQRAARVVVSLAGAAAVALVPVAHLGVVASTSAGERLVYWPSALVAAGLGVAVAAIGLSGRRVAGAGAAVAVLAGSVLVAGNLRWRDGAALADGTATALAALPDDRPVHLVGLVEMAAGVPAMRNATAPTLVLRHGWSNPPPVDELALVEIDGGRPPTVRATRRGPERWRFELSGGATFSAIADGRHGWTVPGVMVERRGRRAVEVVWTGEPPTVAYYSGGELVPLDVGAP